MRPRYVHPPKAAASVPLPSLVAICFLPPRTLVSAAPILLARHTCNGVSRCKPGQHPCRYTATLVPPLSFVISASNVDSSFFAVDRVSVSCVHAAGAPVKARANTRVRSSVTQKNARHAVYFGRSASCARARHTPHIPRQSVTQCLCRVVVGAFGWR